MGLRIAIAVVILLFTEGSVLAQSADCHTSPLLDDLTSKEDRIRILMERGGACVREGKPLESIEIFSQLIELRPDDTVSYLNRGNAYLQSGQFDLGIADLSHVISLDPGMAEAWYNRGVGFLAARQYTRAIDDLNEVIRLKPDFARAYCNRAYAKFQNSDEDSALIDSEAGSKKDTAIPFCHFVSGEVYYARANYSKAVDAFSAGLKSKPNLQALIKRGEAFEHLGDRKSALADFESALTLNPQSKDALDGKARLEFQ